MPPNYCLEVTAATVRISDSGPRPKVSKKCYGIVCPSNIPGVEVAIIASDVEETIALTLPAAVTKLIPVLAECHGTGSPDANHSSSTSSNQAARSGSTKKKKAAKGRDNTSNKKTQSTLAPHQTSESTGLSSPEGGQTIELPGGMWALIVTLKLLTEDDFSEELLFACDDDPHACTAANILETADWLGCVAVSSRVQAWLRVSFRGLVLERPANPGDEYTARGVIMCNALQHLSDDAFSVQSDKEEAQGLIDSVSEAIRLPPMLCVKWLRADCCTKLDLSEVGWDLPLWRGTVACLHAVPNLKQLHVALPISILNTQVDKAAFGLFGATQVCCPSGRSNAQWQPPQYACVCCGNMYPQHSACSSCGFNYLHGQRRDGAASEDAIRALMQAVVALPCLTLLDLEKSWVSIECMTAIAGVLSATAATLTELRMPSWVPAANGHVSVAGERQRQIFGAMSRLKQLQVLAFQDWAVFVGDEAHSSAAALGRSLPQLKRVEVLQYPCQGCAGASTLSTGAVPCKHFPAALPFKGEECDWNISMGF